MARENAVMISNAVSALEAIEAVRDDIEKTMDDYKYSGDGKVWLDADDYDAILACIDALIDKRCKALEEM